MNFTSSAAIQTSPPVSFDHYFGSENQRNRTEVLFHIPCKTFQATSAWFEHSNLFKVNVPSAHRHLLKGIQRHANEPTSLT